MKAELLGSLGKALLKGCLWMGESDGIPEGGQDEVSQQLRLPHQWHPMAAKAHNQEIHSICYYL